MTNRTSCTLCEQGGCDRPARSRGLCASHYRRLLRNGTAGDTPIGFALSTAERFWRYVDKGGPDGCWLWTGARVFGYAVFRESTERSVKAHRWLYEHSVGPIPDGLDLDHLCRRRACVNPDHLEPVTRSENVLRGNVARSVGDERWRVAALSEVRP